MQHPSKKSDRDIQPDHPLGFGNRFSAAEMEAIIGQLAGNMDLVFFLHSPGYEQLYYVSSVFEKIWELPSSQLFEDRMVFFDTIHPDDRDRVALELSGKYQERHEKEYRIVTPSGLVRWIRDLSLPLRNERGEIWIIAGFAEDISNRKRIEQQLKENEHRYRLLFNSVKDPILVHLLPTGNRPGKFIEVNQSACDLFETTRDTMLTLTSADLIPPNRKSHAHKLAEKLLKYKSVIFRTTLVSGSSRIFPVEIHSQLFDLNGIPTVLSIVRDITDRKNRETYRRKIQRKLLEMVRTRTSDLLEINRLLNREIEERKKSNNELRTNKARLEAILNASKDALFLADTKGTLLLLNQEVADRFGKTKEALLGKNIQSLYSPESAKSRFAILEQLVATKTAVNFQDTRDGHIFDNCAYPIFDTEDRITQLAVFSRDVTQEIQAQTALAESEKRYRSFVQNFKGIAFQSVITGETHFTSLFCHGAVESITGYTERDYTHRQEHWEDMIHPEDRKRFLESRKQLATIPDTSLEIEYRLKRKDNQYRWVKESIQNICGNAGKPILVEGVIYDISDRKQAEMAVKQLSRKLLDRIEDERKKIARDLHDEFGQVLTALRFNMEEIMRVSLANAPPYQVEAISEKCGCVIQQIETLSESVRQITTELRPDLLDHLGLDCAIGWHIDNFRQHHPAVQVTYKTVGLKNRLDAKTEIALYRVFQEGLNNIIKHAKAEHIKISLICSFPSVILKLEDDGIGFVSKPREAAPEFHLKGIGLLSMGERMAAIGGSIKIDSALGRGTRIRVEAPYYRRNVHE
jgi:PAS domain S-box-containing protein